MDFIGTTQKLLHKYMSATKIEDMEEFYGILAEDCVIIGTGRYKHYVTARDFIEGLKEDIEKRGRYLVKLSQVDEWIDLKKFNDASYLVYGGLNMLVKDNCDKIYVSIESRFSICYSLRNGKWYITHFHHSIPFTGQMNNESYPELIEKIRKAEDNAEKMRILARQDTLTGLLNHGSFYADAEQLAQVQKNIWCITIDLDDFKAVNDNLGHLMGDEVLKTIAYVIKKSFRKDDIIGRIGGDEFAVVCKGVFTEEKMRKMLDRFVYEQAIAGQNMSFWPAVSVGAVLKSENESIRDAFHRADRTLYTVKNRGKNGYKIVT